jgi:hypothetical protein
MALYAPAGAQTPRPGDPPPPGWSLGIALGAGWHSNPLELNRPSKGDAFLTPEISLGFRQPLWEGGALSINLAGTSELYGRETRSGYHRALASFAVSHNWAGTIFSLTASARKTLSHDLARHDGASQELAFGVFRAIPVAEGWTLLLNARLARRFVDDGTEDQWRASANATLVHRRGAFIMRLGGGLGYALEDKTLILPRINDRSINLRAGIGYEWARDREVAIGISYNRTFSSYEFNRYKSLTIQPRISASFRF